MITLQWPSILSGVCLMVLGCAHSARAEAPYLAWPVAQARFEQHTRALAEALTIPGVAYAVVADGRVVATGEVADSEGPSVGVDTPLRFASVTKALTAVMLMRAAERGRLSLDDSASVWLPEFTDRPNITLRHLAAHVSEGAPGEEYVYGTTRYSKLGGLLATAFGAESYQAALHAEIIEPTGIEWRDSPHLGAHAGFVSTVSDMAKFVGALQRGVLLTEASLDAMATPYESSSGSALPVGVGWFSQRIGGEGVIWSFGQDDPDHSSALLVLLPDRNLGLVMLANTDELSNPFRLLMGNLRTSPFATAFLDAFAPDIGVDISERERLVSRLLIAAWNQDFDAADALLNTVIRTQDAPTGDDFALHLVASGLGCRDRLAFCEALDEAVLAAHPSNRWALLVSGELNVQLDRPQIAVRRFEDLLALPNQEPDFLGTLFRAWAHRGAAMALKRDDPGRALAHIERGLATGVSGETREQLEQIRAELTI